MGEVFAARQRSLQRSVAIKFLRPDLTRGADREQRFLREAQSAAAVSHPGVIAIHGVGRHDGRLFLVMERVDGESLETQLRQGLFSIAEAVRIITELADAVAAIHRAGIVHRDLKPGNVLISRDGRVQVGDFGLSKLLQPDAAPLSVDGQVIGTPQYMAPEQADPRWGPISPRTDVYGLGAVLYVLLTGRPPVQADNLPTLLACVVKGRGARSPRSVRIDVPLPLDDLCRRCLAPLPGDRFADAAEVRKAISRLPELQKVIDPAASAGRRRLAIAGCIVAAGLLGLMVTRWRPNDSAASVVPQLDSPEPVAAPRRDRAESRWRVKVFRDRSSATSEKLSVQSPPLRTGDAVQVEMAFDRPRYALLYWVSASGGVQLLSSIPASGGPQIRILAPADPVTGLPLDPPAGVEVCIVLHANVPLDATDWQSRLELPRELKIEPSGNALLAYSGRLETEAWPGAGSSSAAIAPELAAQLSQTARPVGTPVPVRAPTLTELLLEWKRLGNARHAELEYLVLQHIDW